jgi:pSer/pThr/pTyr-binding forkhead associated (FHA) protein
VALNRPVLTLGRRAENDIVLPVSSVSREHAQIRWRFGRFVIYDLGSRAGTLVNGEPVSECVLHPGDIVTLSTVKLVYGEGEGDTGPRPQRDGATAVLPPLNDQD